MTSSGSGEWPASIFSSDLTVVRGDGNLMMGNLIMGQSAGSE